MWRLGVVTVIIMVVADMVVTWAVGTIMVSLGAILVALAGM